VILRKRQEQFVECSLAALHEHKNTLAVASTGFGKTVSMSAVIDRSLKNGMKRICSLAHRDELVNQNRDKFHRFSPNITTSVINAKEKSWAGQVTFAMVPTLSRENNLWEMPPLDLLVIDEAHHAVADSYLRVIQYAKDKNPEVQIYGVTATAGRGDGKGLRQVFSNVADHVKLSEIIRDGHLVPPRTFAIDVGVQDDLRGVATTGGEYDQDAVAAILDHPQINDSVVKNWKDKAGDRKTIVFCSTVNHAKNVCSAFMDAGINAAVISGDMNAAERQGLLYEFDRGDLQVLLNCHVLTEGFDSQPVSCIVLLRLSSRKSTFIQMVGRGLRTVDPEEYPGVVKTDCVVLDFGTSAHDHGSLEQDIQLDGRQGTGEAPRKMCPECDASIPMGCRECPLCGYEWPKNIAEPSSELLADFVLSEVDLLKRSSFQWSDLFGDDAALLATGFEAWSGAFYLKGCWYGVGGKKKHAARVLATGERIVCIAAADDWLNEHETEDGAQKSKKWLKQAATPQQLKFLPAHKTNFGLTRYHASCLLAFQFNKRDIQSVVQRASLSREVN
jgi:DNA repair protein RadD